MVALDASVLAYAVNRFAPEHPRAARVVEALVNGDAPWVLAWPEVHAFLGFVSHPHAVVRPLGARDAWALIEGLLASPTVRAIGPTERHGAVVAELLAALPAGATGTRGLETAAVLREHGVRELLSADRAMRRFAFLTVRDPVHGEPWLAEAPPARRYRTLGPRGSRS